MKLGTLLIRDRVITLDQLEAALRAQVLFGGKLGSNLVELGHISVDTLAEYLGRTLDLPAATRELLHGSDPAARAKLSADVARILVAHPIRFEGERLAVALANPTDRAIVEACERAVAMPVAVYVAPELSIEEFLERHYGIERKTRMRIAPAKRPPTPLPILKIVHRDPVGAKKTAAPPPGSGLAASLSDTLSELERATEKEQIAEAVLRFARGRLETALLFLVRHDEALWWKGTAPGVEAADLDGTAISLWTPSCLSIAFGSHAAWRGKPEWVHDPLWALLRVPPPDDAFVAPIMIGNHVANLLYAHAPGRGKLDDGIVDAMETVVGAAGEAYARLMRAAKGAVT